MEEKILFLPFMIVFVITSVFYQKPLVFLKKSVAPGSKSHFEIPVISDKDSTIIPITAFHDSKSGLILGITEGIHG